MKDLKLHPSESGPTRRDDLREMALNAASEISLGPLSTLKFEEYRTFAADLVEELEKRIACLH